MEFALVDEVAGVDLGDKRLTERLAIIIDRLGAQPNLSIPAAMHSRSEMEAAYRFFANEAVTPDALGQLTVFLCSPAADQIRGAAMPVDGAWTAQ